MSSDNTTATNTVEARAPLPRIKRGFPFNPEKYQFKFTQKKRCGIQDPSRLMLTSCPEHLTRWIHPGYRHLVPWSHRFRGIVVKRSIAAKIKKRTVYYFPFPRVFPYFCDICQMTTPELEFALVHPCVRRRPRDFDPENEQKIMTLGVRSKAKDKLAVMERLPNPQHYRLFTYTCDEDLDPILQRPENESGIPRLSDTCIDRLSEGTGIDIDSLESSTKASAFGDEFEIDERCMCATCGLEWANSSEYFEHLAVEPDCLEERRQPVPLGKTTEKDSTPVPA